MDLTPSISVSSCDSDLFLGIYNDSDDVIEFDVILGVNTLSKMTCMPRRFTPALCDQTFVPLVALAYHRTTLQLLSPIPEKKVECFLVRGELRADLRLELVNSGWKVTPQDGKTIYGHRGTAGFDPQKLSYAYEEQDQVSFCELPKLKF